MSDNAGRIVEMIERGRRSRLDEAAMALYVESRIALIDYPDIRLRTETVLTRWSVIVHVWGWHRASHWRAWGIEGGMEVWADLIFEDAEMAAAEVRWRVEREFMDLMRRDTRRDNVKAEVAEARWRG